MNLSPPVQTEIPFTAHRFTTNDKYILTYDKYRITVGDRQTKATAL